MPENITVQLRQLQYRLKRQGMLELDVWLLPLQEVLATKDEQLLTSIKTLLNREVPELLAMQSGQQEIPKELQPWLNI